jgi:hypothetical protein
LLEAKLQREQLRSEYLESEVKDLRVELQEMRRLVNGLTNANSPSKELTGMRRV